MPDPLEHDDEQRRVRDLEDRFFDLSIDLLCFLDFSGHFKRLNPAWETTLGFTRQELMSKPFIEFVHPDDRERTLNQNRSVRAGAQARHFENRYLCKDGSYRWLLWNATPDTDRRVIYSVARDITSRKQVEDERDRLLAELQTALAEVKTLRAFLPICAYCKNVRDDENYWHSVEVYVSTHTNTRFSHGICPSCYTKVVEPDLQTGTGALAGGPSRFAFFFRPSPSLSRFSPCSGIPSSSWAQRPSRFPCRWPPRRRRRSPSPRGPLIQASVAATRASSRI